MKTDRYDTAESLRKLVLAHCIKYPHRSTRDLATALSIKRDSAGCIARDMCKRGEMQQHGRTPYITYTACTTTTITAAEIRKIMREKKQIAAMAKYGPSKPKEKPKKNVIPGRYVNDPWADDHVAPTNQRGQGSLMPRAHIGSTAGML